ncbi:hypothetical protein [Luteolibacter sp. Populi]|uniref:hypothetical protein n=1 Tax=Luteolibacter sp. Populi TaxID=3230487 RepID=UPI0034650431
MKTPLAFLAGAGAGALAMWLAMPQPRQATATGESKPPAGREAPQNHASTEDEMRPAKTQRPAAAEEDDDAVVLDEDDMDSADMKGIRESMAKELAERKLRRIDERLAAMKARLNLDNATAAKVRALLEAGDEEEDLVSKMMNDADSQPPTPGEEARKRAALEDSIAKLLTPDQATAYTQFTREQKENRIEVATGREMTRLQQNLTLTPDQKDKVFQALNQIAAGEDDMGSEPITLDPEELKSRRQARLDGLKPLLTPEQYQAYEHSSVLGAFQLNGDPPVK